MLHERSSAAHCALIESCGFARSISRRCSERLSSALFLWNSFSTCSLEPHTTLLLEGIAFRVARCFEHLAGTDEELHLSGRDLVGIKVELLGRLADRAALLQSLQDHLRFEAGREIPSGSSAHQVRNLGFAYVQSGFSRPPHYIYGVRWYRITQLV